MEGACSDTDKSVLSKVKFGVFLRNGGVEAWQRGAACRFSSDQPSSTEQPKRAGLPQLPAEEPPSTFTAASKRGPPHSPRGHRIPASPPPARGAGQSPTEPGHRGRSTRSPAGPGARGNSAARRRREVRQGPERRARCRGTSRCGPGAALRAEPGQGAWAGRQGAAPGGNGEGEKALPL